MVDIPKTESFTDVSFVITYVGVITHLTKVNISFFTAIAVRCELESMQTAQSSSVIASESSCTETISIFPIPNPQLIQMFQAHYSRVVNNNFFESIRVVLFSSSLSSEIMLGSSISLYK